MEEEKKSGAPKATAKKAASNTPAAPKKPAVKKPEAKEAEVVKEASKAETPKAEVKKTEVPKIEVKKVETPKAEVKKVETPKAKDAPAKVKVVSRLKIKFEQVVSPKMMGKYHYTSIMETPRLEKIIINVGVGDAIINAKVLDDSVRELREIAGQQPVITKAKKSIANFKLREGQAIGCKVTLRGLRMYDFLDKLVTIALPRVRDFRGVSRNAFDGHGNYTLGVKEQLIFPEIDYDKVNKIRGMDIVIVTTARNDDEAFTLLSELGMPFRK
jgi:large subunit ribosomal protein L5